YLPLNYLFLALSDGLEVCAWGAVVKRTAPSAPLHLDFQRIRSAGIQRTPTSFSVARTRTALLQQLDVTHAARKIARPPDAVRIVWVDLNSSRIRLRVCQREFRERFSFRIEAGHFIHVLFAKPNQRAFGISLH